MTYFLIGELEAIKGRAAYCREVHSKLDINLFLAQYLTERISNERKERAVYPV